METLGAETGVRALFFIFSEEPFSLCPLLVIAIAVHLKDSGEDTVRAQPEMFLGVFASSLDNALYPRLVSDMAIKRCPEPRVIRELSHSVSV